MNPSTIEIKINGSSAFISPIRMKIDNAIDPYIAHLGKEPTALLPAELEVGITSGSIDIALI